MKTLSLLIVAGVLFTGILNTASQNCRCSPNLCCSQYGYCGNGEKYCGPGCQEGPCYEPPPTNNVSIASVVTDAFFNGIVNQSAVGCKGRPFYTRSVFLEATQNYPQFGRVGSENDSRRELAAFFAHVTHGTGRITVSIYNNTQYPCNPNKGYYGRGPIQLSWNYNYGPAGASIGFDGLNNPEKVATDPIISFRTAFWFWIMNDVQSLLSDKGFGATIRAINGLECDGGNPATVTARVQYYTQYCNQLGVAPGVNLTC